MESDDEEETVAYIASLPYDLPTYENWSAEPNFYHPLMAGSIDGTDIVPHDHGVVRAMRSRYRPNKKVTGSPECTVMVRHLNLSTKEATIRDVFSGYGAVSKCRLVRDVVTGFSKGYAFVEYKDRRDARNALRNGHDLVIDSQKVVVDYELERTLVGWIPRRFGGGIGGKKESGQLRFGGSERPFRRPIPVNSKPLGTQMLHLKDNLLVADAVNRTTGDPAENSGSSRATSGSRHHREHLEPADRYPASSRSVDKERTVGRERDWHGRSESHRDREDRVRARDRSRDRSGRRRERDR